jgi:hypothetical protein
VAVHVFSLSGRGQNRLSMSHSAQATVERTAVANSSSSPGTGHSGTPRSPRSAMERGQAARVGPSSLPLGQSHSQASKP